MPPHIDDAITMPRATYTIAAEDLTNVVNDMRTGGLVHTTMTAPRTEITDPLYHTYTTDHITIDAIPWTIPTFVTEEDLQKVVKKIYNIITDHTTLDISEEEFMSMLKDDNNE